MVLRNENTLLPHDRKKRIDHLCLASTDTFRIDYGYPLSDGLIIMIPVIMIVIILHEELHCVRIADA